ncbi:MAG: response regulator [Betaproteobacteria bacterium]|nr:response regulator [Betaproteobacteria bacterium]NBT11567.1 response regulator [Betaproteobacteria bacterium]
MATILVVDDELGIRALLTEILSDEGHTVEAAEDAAHARVLRERLQPDLVLLDIWMPDVDGITLLKEWNSAGQLTMPVIMMSGHGTIDTAVEAMKFGAAAFLEKPVTLQKLLRAVEEGLNRGAEPRWAAAAGAMGIPAHGPGGAGTALGAAPPVSAAAAARPGLVGMPAYPGAEASAGNWAAAPAGGVMAEGERYAAGGGNASMGSQQSFELDRPLREARDAFEKSYFEYHLARENGSMTRVAEKTGLERTHLYRKLKHLGVDLSRTKRSQQ